MKQIQLLHALDKLDQQKTWAFRVNLLKMMFPEINERSLAVSLNRHVKNGLIKKVSRGVYANPRASSKPAYYLESLANIIRPGEQFYLSLESNLSDAGYISQMPNRLTFVTTGRSQTFKTEYGILEFVHSNRDAKKFLTDCEFDTKRNIWIASVEKALRDLNRTSRSQDLVIYKEVF